MAENHATTSPSVLPGVAKRLFAPDVLRGLIIAWMALDHANIFIAHKHPPAEMWGGTFPVYYDVLAFLTRFVTHFCAPGFFFLMGVGMALFAASRQDRGWSKWQVLRHFLIRGSAIIALKLLVVNRIWELSPDGWGIQTYIGVLFALGANMILGSFLLRLKPGYLLGMSAVLLVGMEFLVPDPSSWGPGRSALELILLVPGGINAPAGGAALWSNYPVLPWSELVIFGIAFGGWLARDPLKAYSRAWKFGLSFLLVFVVVRYLDGFGNIRPRMGDTWMDFLNPVKYPPSITFTLMTTGVNLLLLWVFSKVIGWAARLSQVLVVFGRAPLFFYVMHLLIYAWLGYVLTPQGTSIVAMYPLWLLGLVILYPLCLWYGQLKHTKPARLVLQFL